MLLFMQALLCIERKHRKPRAKQSPSLFNNQRNKQQTALPLPVTGEQTGPKACPRQEKPERLLDGEMPKPCE